jgi:hypothetical protein
MSAGILWGNFMMREKDARKALFESLLFFMRGKEKLYDNGGNPGKMAFEGRK